MWTNQAIKKYIKGCKQLALFLLFFSFSTLFASGTKDPDCSPLLQEIIDLPEEQQIKRLYTQEFIAWQDFTFTYIYPDPVINALVAKWTNNQSSISQPDPILPENQANTYSSHPDDINRLWDDCEKRGLLRDFFFAMVENPKKFCVREGYSAPRTEFPPLEISECACVNTGAYDRLITDRRYNFENAMIQSLRQNFSNKNQTIRIMSLGCGDLLQETILLGRLILEGFSSIEMTLVDFCEDNETFEGLQEFFNQTFPEVVISWSRAQTISNIKQNTKFDLIYAIDFDDLFYAYEIKDTFYNYITPNGERYREEIKNVPDTYDCLNLIESSDPEGSDQRKNRIDEFYTGIGDIIQARNLLTPSGTLFLGKGGQDMSISSTNDLKLFHQDNYFKQEKTLQSAPLNAVHILTNIHHPGTVFSLLVTLLDRGCETVYLTMENRDYTSQMKMIINGEEISKEHTYKTTSHLFMQKLFSQFSDKITVKLVNDIRPFIQGAHATFLDIDYIRGDLSEYNGAAHTVILNRCYEENKNL